MADRGDLSKVLSNVENELTGAPAPAPRPQASVEAFAPAKYRNANDSMEQIQRDLAKAILDTEQRTKALIEELKRITS